MRRLWYGVRSHPYMLSRYLSLNVVVHVSPIILPVGLVLSLLYLTFYLGRWWVRGQLARRDAVHERANCSDSGRASMATVSRERFTPTSAAGDVTFTVRICVPRLRMSTPRIHKNAHGRICLLYTSPSPRDLSTSRMPSSA